MATDRENLPSIAAFLSRPASYPHRPRRVELLQTHISYVAIAPPFVFKVKKPVNFGFVDFSTLEKRCYYSKREIELNRRFCPETYLEVLPISRRGEELCFGGGEEIIDYAVKLRRLRKRYFLKELLALGAVGSREIERIVEKLVSFYRREPPLLQAAGLEGFRQVTEENFAQTASSVGLVLSRETYEALRVYTNLFYEKNGWLLDRRVAEGWVRDCHGDLHSEHIHLAPNRLCIFDCIEFNDAFRCIDVAYDFAFLAMDLDFLGHGNLSRLFLARMVEELGDANAWPLLEFYACQRAYIRGKVACLKAQDPGVPEAERSEAVALGGKYFGLALRYALLGLGPVVLVVMGRIGSGKSSLASSLAEEAQLPYFSTDVLRKESLGLPLTYRPCGEEKARIYSPEGIEAVYRGLYARAEEKVLQGQSVLLDGTFGRKARRQELLRRLEERGVPCFFLELETPETERRQRLLLRKEEGQSASDADLKDMADLDGAYEPPEELSPKRLVRISGSGNLREVLARALLTLIEGRLA